ncbi:MAG: CoA transferase, partial [Dehalococcoidia bacterium]
DAEQRATTLGQLHAMRSSGRPYAEIAAAAMQARGIAAAGTNLYYRVYQTADGFLAVAALSHALRSKFCRVVELDDPRQAPGVIEPGSDEAREIGVRLVAVAEATIRNGTTEAWLARFDAAGVPAGPVRFVDELFDDPQVQANGLMVEVDHPLAGTLQMVGPPIQMSGTPLQPQGASPTLGQHTDAVLDALGYSRTQTEDLRSRGIVR